MKNPAYIYAKAIAGYRKMALAGDEAAQLQLGMLYENGQGAPRNYPEALRWYRKAADQGSDGAHLRLGVLFANGRGVVQDRVTATAHFLTAHELGSADGERLAEKISARMTESEILEGREKALEMIQALKKKN